MKTCLVNQLFDSTQFDGKKKDFSDVEHLFDAAIQYKGGTVSSRDEVKETQVAYFEEGFKLTIIHFRRVGLNCIDVQLRGGIEGKEDAEFRIIYAIEDNKVAWGRVVEDNFFSAMKARCSSGFRTYNVMNKYPTNM